MKVLVFLLFSSFLSFSQSSEFKTQTIGFESSLNLSPNGSFIMKSVIWACQGEDYHYSEYKGDYQILNSDTLVLKPKKEAFFDGIISDNLSLEEINESKNLRYKDFTASKGINAKYEILKFPNFQILLALEKAENEFQQENDLIRLSNFLNSISELTEEDGQWIKQNFYSTPINNFPLIKENLIKTSSIKGKKEILQVPITAKITSVKEKVVQNKNYDSRIHDEDAKYITLLYLEIDAGTEDGVFTGMSFYPISDKNCANIGLYVEKVTENKSFINTEKLLDDGFCDPNIYNLNQEVTTQP